MQNLLASLLKQQQTRLGAYGSAILDNIDTAYLDQALLDEQGQVRVVSAQDLLKVPEDHLRVWFHRQAIYAYPTIELIEWLRQQIGDRSAIEIGAGNGAIGRALGIPITDSRMQEIPEIKAYYEGGGQPVVKYGTDIQKYDALAAIQHFKPDVVIGSWITHVYREDEHDLGGNMFGVDERAVIGAVKTYIHIGATSSHSKKRILNEKHQAHQFEWLISRGVSGTRRIWVWGEFNE